MSLISTPVSKALIEELEARYPTKNPSPADTLPEIMFRAGQVSLVEYLRAGYEAQQNPEQAFKIPIK